MSLIARILDGACSLAAPPRCAGCGGGLPKVSAGSGWKGLLCASCARDLRVLVEACQGCGQAIGPRGAEAQRCVACRGTPRGGVDSTTALVRYRATGRAVLARLKYGGLAELGPALGEDLARRFALREPEAAADPDLVVVAVPLHPWRRWRRGYNQAEEIARGVSRALQRPLVKALRRIRATPALYDVEHGDRAEVVAGAFGAAQVEGLPVALVDDIRTSGATLREAAQALREAGATRVDALVVGR